MNDSEKQFEKCFRRILEERDCVVKKFEWKADGSCNIEVVHNRPAQYVKLNYTFPSKTSSKQISC